MARPAIARSDATPGSESTFECSRAYCPLRFHVIGVGSVGNGWGFVADVSIAVGGPDGHVSVGRSVDLGARGFIVPSADRRPLGVSIAICRSTYRQ